MSFGRITRKISVFLLETIMLTAKKAILIAIFRKFTHLKFN